MARAIIVQLISVIFKFQAQRLVNVNSVTHSGQRVAAKGILLVQCGHIIFQFSLKVLIVQCGLELFNKLALTSIGRLAPAYDLNDTMLPC
jgi:hypothetical protein